MMTTQLASDSHRRALFAAFLLIRSATLAELKDLTQTHLPELGRAFDIPAPEARDVVRRMEAAGFIRSTEKREEPEAAASNSYEARQRNGEVDGTYAHRQSIHPYEVILAYLTFQRDVLGRKRLYDLERFAGILFKGSRHSGSQDSEITLWRNSRFSK